MPFKIDPKKEKIVEFNMITMEQYNALSKDGRKSLKLSIVQSQDNTYYQINHNGSLVRMLAPINLDPEKQRELARAYQEQNRSQSPKVVNIPPKTPQAADDIDIDNLVA